MAYTASQVADAVWTYSTRTLNPGSATTGTTLSARIADAVWTYSTRTLTSAAQVVTAPATSITISGPASVYVNQSSLYIVTLSPVGSTSSPITITPSSTAAGTFSPASIVLSTSSPSVSFTFMPTATGAGTLSITNSGTLSNPVSIAYSATVSVISVYSFDPNEHTVTIGLNGSTAIVARHVSDQQIVSLRAAVPGSEKSVVVGVTTLLTSL